jgi:hypothetical protein
VRPRPDTGRLAEALTAITGGEPPTWHPAVVASVTVDDPDAAADRLRAAGFTVDIPPAGLPVVATVTVAGICVRIRPAG